MFKTAAVTPSRETAEMDLNAGCLAKIKAPMAKIVVNTASRIDVRYVGISSLPVLYSFCRAAVINMAKSTP
ncbi:hypothetical protein D3C81_1018680 [compost metagenome]